MRRIREIIAILMTIVLFTSQLAYANSASDFFTKSKWSKGVQHWATKSVYRDTLRNKIGSAHWWNKSVYQGNLKNKIGSAHWWTSSAWSKKAQKFGCATGSWVNRNKKVIGAAGSMGVGLPLLAVGLFTLNPVALYGSVALLCGGSIGMMFALPKNTVNK